MRQIWPQLNQHYVLRTNVVPVKSESRNNNEVSAVSLKITTQLEGILKIKMKTLHNSKKFHIQS
jgi:hypothetical protein